MTLKLRPATLSDAPALTEILHRAKASWGYPADKMQEFREAFQVSEATIRSQHVTIAEENGRPLAFSGAYINRDRTLHVDFLFVEPEAQNRGLGNLLLLRLEDYARKNRLNRLYLESDTHAGPFYERKGFRTIGTRPSAMAPGRDIPLMEKILAPAVHRLRSLDLKVSPGTWAFETNNRQAIADHFAAEQRKNPAIWNGRTLKLTNFSFEDGVLTGEMAHCEFASFLAWRDWGYPDPDARNIFGSAVLLSRDGALLYGVMAPHTSTAGKIYPPGGNLDPQDVTADGKVDIVASIYRELTEETGITREQTEPGDLLLAFDGPRISVAQVLRLNVDADEARDSMMRFSTASEEQELSDIRILRGEPDLADPEIIPYAREVAQLLLQ